MSNEFEDLFDRINKGFTEIAEATADFVKKGTKKVEPYLKEATEVINDIAKEAAEKINEAAEEVSKKTSGKPPKKNKYISSWFGGNDPANAMIKFEKAHPEYEALSVIPDNQEGGRGELTEGFIVLGKFKG